MHDDTYTFDDGLTDDERAALAQQAEDEDEYIRIQEERATAADRFSGEPDTHTACADDPDRPHGYDPLKGPDSALEQRAYEAYQAVLKIHENLRMQEAYARNAAERANRAYYAARGEEPAPTQVENCAC